MMRLDLRAPTSRAVVCLLCTLPLAGCGGSSHHGAAASGRTTTAERVTVPAYGTFHATTETITTGSPALCRRDATSFARDAVTFLVPSATPADQYFVSMRLQFFDFQAHSCDPRILRKALSSRLNAKQRRALVARLPFLGDVARKLE